MILVGKLQNMDNGTNLIAQSRAYIIDFRNNKPIEKLDCFFLAMMEIVVSLVELGIERGRPITAEEQKNWFQGSYHLDFWDSELNTNIYLPIVHIAEKQNYFRNPK